MKVISHRGAHSEFPENTMAAFRCAVDIGVDAIETDVLVSKDGHFVLRHDDTLFTGGQWHYVKDLTWDELKRIDLGKGHRIPSLEEFLETYIGMMPLFLDVKCHGISDSLIRFLKPYRSRGPLHITTFLQDEIIKMGTLDPSFPRSIVMTALPPHFEPILEKAGVREISLFRGYLHPAMISRLHEKQIVVRVYPVNMPREAEQLASWDVEGIFTDQPSLMQFLRAGK